MHHTRGILAAAIGLLAVACVSPPVAAAVVAGQVDTFEDGTLQGWQNGGASNPNPATHVATGGPAGTDDAFMRVTSNGGAGSGGKLVVFTESLVTQDYLRELLVESGLVTDQEVTLFRGTNTGPRVEEALGRWRRDVGDALPVHARPSRDVAIRLSLVHEFKHASRVFISTSAVETGRGGLEIAAAVRDKNAVGAIADPLFREFLVPFELTSILLLVAIIGAVLLAKRKV